MDNPTPPFLDIIAKDGKATVEIEVPSQTLLDLVSDDIENTILADYEVEFIRQDVNPNMFARFDWVNAPKFIGPLVPFKNFQFKVENSKIGMTLVESERLRFNTASDTLDPESQKVVGPLVAILRGTPWPMKVIGHTDSDGSTEGNQALSERRAENVKKILQGVGAQIAGIDTDRITSEGKGETEPFATNDTPEGKAANRRVEILIAANLSDLE